MFRVAVLLVMGLLLSTRAEAQTPVPTTIQCPTICYHVAPTGSDTNPGTAIQPFRTIQRATNVVRPGDKILVHAGTYPEVVQLKRSGTAGLPIVLRTAGDGEVIVQPTLTAESCSSRTPTWNRAIRIQRGVDYVRVRDLTVVGGILVADTSARCSRISQTALSRAAGCTTQTRPPGHCSCWARTAPTTSSSGTIRGSSGIRVGRG